MLKVRIGESQTWKLHVKLYCEEDAVKVDAPHHPLKFRKGVLLYDSILPLSTLSSLELLCQAPCVKLMARGNCDIWDALQWLRQQPFRICLLGVCCVVCSVKRMNRRRCLDQRSLDESTWQKAHVNLPNSSKGTYQQCHKHVESIPSAKMIIAWIVAFKRAEAAVIRPTVCRTSPHPHRR